MVKSAKWKPRWLFSEKWLQPYIFLDVKHGKERLHQSPGSTSIVNDAEAWLIPRIVGRLRSKGIESSRVIVITFYAAQVRAIQKELACSFGSNGKRKAGSSDTGLERVCTVDSIQGSEADVVILSFVRSNPRNNVGFVSDYRRLNVALTRAKFSLIVVGNYQTLVKSGSPDIEKLVLNARKRSVMVDSRQYF